MRAALFALVAWSALVCTGIGGGVGMVNAVLAGKFSPHLHHLQRQSGTSLATRAAPRGVPHVAAAHQFADVRCCAIVDHAGGALPASASTLRVESPDGHGALSPSTDEPPRKPDQRAHPSRAPPALA